MKILAIIVMVISLLLIIEVPILGIIVLLMGAILFGWAEWKAHKIEKLENERFWADFWAHQAEMKAEEIAKLESRDLMELKMEEIAYLKSRDPAEVKAEKIARLKAHDPGDLFMERTAASYKSADPVKLKRHDDAKQMGFMKTLAIIVMIIILPIGLPFIIFKIFDDM